MKRIVILFLFPLVSLAQELPKRTLTFNSATFLAGEGSGGDGIASFSDFEKLSSNSELLKADLTGFNENYYQDNSFTYTGIYFDFRLNSKKEQPVFKEKTMRFGISFAESTPLTLSYYKNEHFRIDTLTSSRTGQETYIDSIYGENYDLDYTQRFVFLNAAYLVNTNSNARFSFYAGLELSLGFSVGSTTEINYYDYESFDGYYGSSNRPYWDNDRKSKTESYRNKSGVAFMSSIPLGVNFRLGNRKEFWRRCYLIAEYKPGLFINSIPEIGTLTNSTSFGSGGVRYEF